ncbi:hypothetical protein BLNAU_23283 [Blattamonas nauphoetae]|uniref:Uncharacterized protein n=1 Tax=Blattamonas nauphoetae TaxID=2049346 RepID=A0ABQ9WUU0_9EUKA|nr:hypothetical protein BLNAU_23283 [Blattamonas nauphoetae]
MHPKLSTLDATSVTSQVTRETSWNGLNIPTLLERLNCEDEDIVVATLQQLQNVASVDRMTVLMIGVDFCLHCVVEPIHLDF